MTRIIALSDTHLENELLPPAVAALAGKADHHPSRRRFRLCAVPRRPGRSGQAGGSAWKLRLPRAEEAPAAAKGDRGGGGQNRPGAHGLARLRPGGRGDDGQGDGCAGSGLRAYPSTSHREGQAVCSSARAAPLFPACLRLLWPSWRSWTAMCGAISFLWAARPAIISSSPGSWRERARISSPTLA